MKDEKITRVMLSWSWMKSDVIINYSKCTGHFKSSRKSVRSDDERSLKCVKDFFRVPSFFTEPIRDSLLYYSSFYGSEK